MDQEDEDEVNGAGRVDDVGHVEDVVHQVDRVEATRGQQLERAFAVPPLNPVTRNLTLSAPRQLVRELKTASDFHTALAPE